MGTSYRGMCGFGRDERAVISLVCSILKCSQRRRRRRQRWCRGQRWRRVGAYFLSFPFYFRFCMTKHIRKHILNGDGINFKIYLLAGMVGGSMRPASVPLCVAALNTNWSGTFFSSFSFAIIAFCSQSFLFSSLQRCSAMQGICTYIASERARVFSYLIFYFHPREREGPRQNKDEKKERFSVSETLSVRTETDNWIVVQTWRDVNSGSCSSRPEVTMWVCRSFFSFWSRLRSFGVCAQCALGCVRVYTRYEMSRTRRDTERRSLN